MGSGTVSRPPARGLKFVPSTHRYYLDSKPVTGVTTILGVLDKPAIPKWAAKTVAEYVADNPDGVKVLRDMGRGPMVAALKEIPWQARDDAADRGTSFHTFAEEIVAGGKPEVPDSLVPHVEQAIDFMERWHIKPILLEAAVGSREHQYAGTLDMIATYTHPVTGHQGTAIWDWKTGKAIYPEYAFQLTAYGHAEFTGLGGNETEIPACDAAFGVQIRSDGHDVYPLQYGADVFAEFVAIRRVHAIVKRARGNWKVPGSGYVGLAVQYPDNEEQDAA